MSDCLQAEEPGQQPLMPQRAGALADGMTLRCTVDYDAVYRVLSLAVPCPQDPNPDHGTALVLEQAGFALTVE